MFAFFGELTQSNYMFLAAVVLLGASFFIIRKLVFIAAAMICGNNKDPDNDPKKYR